MGQIYISTACIKSSSIKESVLKLVSAGFKNIELSGGTKFYPDYKDDLLKMKKEYGLNYLVHNYFPPPKIPFVINLASQNKEIFQKSIDQCKSAIKLSKELESKKYGVHAGFLIDIKANEIGRKLSRSSLSKRKDAIKKFEEGWLYLIEEAGQDITLYLENNVFSMTNSKTYSNNNPFLLTDYESYLELSDKLDFTILLDFAHLQVSCNSLGLEFEREVEKLFPLTNYIHLSDNDGSHDQNKGLQNDGQIMNFIRNNDLNGKTITIEIYSGMDQVIYDYNKILEILN